MKKGPPAKIAMAEKSKAPLGRKIFWKPLREGNIEGTIFAELGKGETTLSANSLF